MAMTGRALFLGCVIAAMVATGAAGEEVGDTAEVHVNIQVVPIAQLELLDDPLLYMSVPPPGSTVPSDGVRFRVYGNALATVEAEPDEFVLIPADVVPTSDQDQWLGKAVLNDGEIGYDVLLNFPQSGFMDSSPQYGALPGYEQGPASVPFVNMQLTGGVRNGIVHLVANQDWTPDGGLPLPGIYEGLITLTVMAEAI